MSSFQDTLAALQSLSTRLKERASQYDTQRATERFGDAVVRGAAAGIALRGSLHLVSYIMGLLAKSSKKRSPYKPTGWALIRDTLRWGAFLGTFSGVFVAADEAIALAGGRKKTRAWRALVSGALAGPSILLLGPENHTSLSLYLFLRGVTLLVRCGNLPSAPAWKRKLLAPTRWQHGDVALMCLSSSQLLYSWIVLPQTLPPSYVRFLNKHGGKSVLLYDAFREMVHNSALGLPPRQLKTLQGTQHEHFHGNIPCSIIHPGQSCTAHAITFLPQGYLRALPVYLPVYIVPAALVHRQRLLRGGKALELWGKIGRGVLRSSLFLSLYCTLAWRGVCFGWQTRKEVRGIDVALFCWITGLATLVEKKSRRMELALYCASRALESFFLSLLALGILSPKRVPPRGDVLLFSLATAAICHCYSDHFGERRDVFRSKYLAVFDFILGNKGFEGATVRHAPSNMDLFLMAAGAVENNAPRAALQLVRSAASLTGLSSDAEIPYHPLNNLRQEGDESSDEDEDPKLARKYL